MAKKRKNSLCLLYYIPSFLCFCLYWILIDYKLDLWDYLLSRIYMKRGWEGNQHSQQREQVKFTYIVSKHLLINSATYSALIVYLFCTLRVSGTPLRKKGISVPNGSVLYATNISLPPLLSYLLIFLQLAVSGSWKAENLPSHSRRWLLEKIVCGLVSSFASPPSIPREARILCCTHSLSNPWACCPK